MSVAKGPARDVLIPYRDMCFRFPLMLVAVILCMSAIAQGQQPGPGPMGGGQPPFPGGRGRLGAPPRDNAPAPSGTAKIAGRVVAAETGAPIRRAQINLNSQDARVSRAIATDSAGHFEITGLPAGRYRLRVSKAGFVPLEYGQARAFEAGKPLDITDGQELDKIDFSLPRGSVITGRITDEYGDPLTDVQVQALRYQFVNGERQLVNAGRTERTNDLGEYRLFGLMPGEYVIHATLREGAAVLRDTAEQTGYPGTYYPGVADVGQAQAVTVTIGQELTSIAFPLVPATLAHVSGVVMSSDGRPLAGAILVVRPRGSGSGSPANLLAGAGRSQSAADGSFRLSAVPPGEYVLEVQQRPMQPGAALQNGFAGLEFASVPLSVSGSIENFTVITTTGVSLSGRVVYEGQSTPPRAALQVTTAGGDGTPLLRAMAGRALGGGRVRADGTFDLQGLYGPLTLRVQGVPAGWALKSVSINGVDATDSPFDFKSGSNITGAVITLTDKLTEITGIVNDSRGQQMSDYVLVVFPDDRALWGAQSRFVQTTRPNQNGTFSMKGLPPGRYLAAVVPSLENGLQHDPAVLEKLRAGGRRFSLADAETLNLNLEMPLQ